MEGVRCTCVGLGCVRSAGVVPWRHDQMTCSRVSWYSPYGQLPYITYEYIHTPIFWWKMIENCFDHSHILQDNSFTVFKRVSNQPDWECWKSILLKKLPKEYYFLAGSTIALHKNNINTSIANSYFNCVGLLLLAFTSLLLYFTSTISVPNPPKLGRRPRPLPPPALSTPSLHIVLIRGPE